MGMTLIRLIYLNTWSQVVDGLGRGRKRDLVGGGVSQEKSFEVLKHS